MCHELESSACITPKDNMDGSKEAANANGNPEGDMLSFTQMYGTPTELIKLGDQVMRSRQSDTHLKKQAYMTIPHEVESPYTRIECSVDDGITYSEKWVADCIFTGRFTPTDIIFKTNTETHSLQFRDRKSLRRVFCNTSMVREKMLCEDWDAKYKSDLFIQNMSNVLRATLYQKLKMVDLVFFPIIKGEHFYVICMNLTITEIHILDKINSDEQDLVKRYGHMPRVLTKLFEDYLSFEKHHREGEMKFAEYKILRMGCRTMKKFVDCGVFAMRHMETYKGEGHYGHICGLRQRVKPKTSY
uniref:Ulp1 protease family, C-terminal catalytic domain-containing protein n=1 Tax=Tanacetum cinerariifolium TaxID=118510 RepID=A0A699JNS2_TANCI|nr:ulp1 protease family, C-terminal catalytic domain-containing protein [Tanacetum cinerariifolium]